MMSSLASASTDETAADPRVPIEPNKPRPHFVDAQLQANPSVLRLRYAAHDPQQPPGDSLILSLVKRLKTDQGANFRPPEIVLELPAHHGESPDSNYDLLVEAMSVFDLSVERALECTHFAGISASLGYVNTSVGLFPQERAVCLFEPTEATQRIRFSAGPR